MPPFLARTLLALPVAALLLACSKPSEPVNDKLAEKAVEAALSKVGTNAKVDLSAAGARVTTTDTQGNAMTMELDNAKVTEADLGVRYYPGATEKAKGTTRITTHDGTTVTAAYASSDPVDKVAAFYRGQLQARAAGKQFFDNVGPNGVALSLMDAQGGSSVQVSVDKTGTGTGIQIIATLPVAK